MVVPHLRPPPWTEGIKDLIYKKYRGKGSFARMLKVEWKNNSFFFFFFKKYNHAHGWVKMHVSMHTIFTLEFQFSLYDSLTQTRHILFKSYDNIIFSVAIARWHLWEELDFDRWWALGAPPISDSHGRPLLFFDMWGAPPSCLVLLHTPTRAIFLTVFILHHVLPLGLVSQRWLTRD